jgi:hypothetical protein
MLANDKTVTVEIKDVYGVAKVYPICDRAKIFADLAGTKTLLPEDIQRIQLLGYKIAVQPRELGA